MQLKIALPLVLNNGVLYSYIEWPYSVPSGLCKNDKRKRFWFNASNHVHVHVTQKDGQIYGKIKNIL